MGTLRCGFWLAVAWALCCGPSFAAFSIVRNIPPDPNIGNNHALASDTQVNLLAGGSIGTNFQAGANIGSSTNVEVNVNGGTVGNQMRANGGSVVNLNAGRIGDSLDAAFGTVVNLNGGSLGNGFDALGGSTVNLRGGTVGVLFDAGNGSQLNIYGAEFYSNGVPIPGTGPVGNATEFVVPINSTLTGTLADGTPFAFSTGPFLTDRITNSTLTLHTTTLRSVGPATAHIVSPSALQGIRAGQTLVVENGGSLGSDFSAGRGSTLTTKPGGVVGTQLELVTATLNVEGGQVGAISAFDGSVINLSSGVAGAIRTYNGSVVNMTGGRIGGQDGTSMFVDSTLNIAGGQFPDFIFEDTVVTFSGGRPFIGVSSRLHGFGNSGLHVRATEFLVDGAPIAGILLGVPLTITQRDVQLTGRFRDGNAFQFELNESDIVGEDYLDGDVVVTVLLVPEPGTMALVALAIACAGIWRRRSN